MNAKWMKYRTAYATAQNAIAPRTDGRGHADAGRVTMARNSSIPQQTPMVIWAISHIERVYAHVS